MDREKKRTIERKEAAVETEGAGAFRLVTVHRSTYLEATEKRIPRIPKLEMAQESKVNFFLKKVIKIRRRQGQTQKIHNKHHGIAAFIYAVVVNVGCENRVR